MLSDDLIIAYLNAESKGLDAFLSVFSMSFAQHPTAQRKDCGRKGTNAQRETTHTPAPSGPVPERGQPGVHSSSEFGRVRAIDQI